MTGILLSIDPGIRGCGAAIFDGGRLVRAAYVRGPKIGNTAHACVAMAREVVEWAGSPVNALALEWPRVYASRIREGSSKGDPNDLLALCGVDSAIASRLPHALVDCFAPSDWKGQLKKEPCAARVRSRLDETELAALAVADAPPSLLHNALDAIGIGLHRLGRGFMGSARRRAIA